MTRAPGCPGENELLSFVDGELAEADRDALEEHLDGCDACHQLLADLAAMLTPEGSAQEPPVGRDAGADERDDQADERDAEADERDPLADESVEAKRRYRLEGRLGSGGMGVVYEAFDDKLQRRVALKLLRPDLSRGDGSQVRERLLREARLLASLAHPNVVTVHDVGGWDDGVFVAAELVRGQSLDQVAELGGWREAAEVYLQAARGLAAAHAVGIVHRDVKPANLLLGEDGRVRLTDFGLATARLASEDEQDSEPRGDTPARQPTLTRQGTLLGTPAYMAPELLEGSAATKAADQYALCLSLAEAIIGERPPAGLRPQELVARAKEAGQRLPAELAELLAKGLASRPDRRHADIAALVERLETLLQTSASGKAGSRHMLLVAAIVAALLGAGWLLQRPALSPLATGALLSAARGLMLSSGMGREMNGAQPTGAADPGAAGIAGGEAGGPPSPPSSGPLPPGAASPAGPSSSALPLLPSAPPLPSSSLPPLPPVNATDSLPVQVAALGQRAHQAASKGDAAACTQVERQLHALQAARPEVDKPPTQATVVAIRHTLKSCQRPRQGHALAVRLAQFGSRVRAARTARDVSACRRMGQELNAMAAKHPELRQPPLSHSMFGIESEISRCLAAVDCDAAFNRFAHSYRSNYGSTMPPERLEKLLPQIFHGSFPECAP